jgi:hypothetical protein
MSMRVSLWAQSQNWAASQAERLSADDTLAKTSAALFQTSNAPKKNSTPSEKALQALLGPFGSTLLNSSTGMAVLAAQQAADRVNAKAAKLQNFNAPAKSVPGVATQVTFSGSLAPAANFGKVGPAPEGGFQFLSGEALKTGFSIAMLGRKSHGEAIDTVSVTRNTLTASTSGLNAHPVFTVTLKPDSGLYTFKLVNPIDLPAGKADKFTTVNLSLLVQGVKADGKTLVLPNSAVVEVHNGLGAASGKASLGVVHEGGLAYTGPTRTSAPSNAPVKRPKYVPPTNPLTGKGYTAKGSSAVANSDVVNILT